MKPLDEKMIDNLCKNHTIVITLEENSVSGGAGSAINEYILANDLQKNITFRNFGLQDKFLNHGTKNLLLDDSSLSVEKISKELDRVLNNEK